MEETVALIKPDAFAAGASDRIIQIAESYGFYVVRKVQLRMTPGRARDFYRGLEGLPHFRVTAEFISSAPLLALVLSKVNAVKAWKELVGPKDPVQAKEKAPGCLRALYGTDTVYNGVHASENLQEARREKNLLFPQGPLNTLVPTEYLVESGILPALVEALGELYRNQPDEPFKWLASWFGQNRPPPRDLLEEHPDPVLSASAGLLADHTPGIHLNSLGAPLYEGTWNFRRCKDRDPVYGIGQSNSTGIKSVVDGLHRSGHRKILWVSLRQDPVMYLDSKPMTARNDLGKQVTVKVHDMASHELRKMENRLKVDVLTSAMDHGGNILVHTFTGESSKVRSTQQRAMEQLVATPADMYAQLQSEALPVEYMALPTEEEQAPSERWLECLVAFMMEVDIGAALVFSCRTGGTRTTLGMIAACLLWRVRAGAEHGMPPNIDPSNPKYERAEYKPVLHVVQELGKTGPTAKMILDDVIDKCNAVDNFIKGILDCRKQVERGHNSEKDGLEGSVVRGLVRMERYIMLLLFSAYLIECAPGGLVERFSAWVQVREDLKPDIRKLTFS